MERPGAVTRWEKLGVGLVVSGIVVAAGSAGLYATCSEASGIRNAVVREVDDLIPPAAPEELRVAQAAVDALIKARARDLQEAQLADALKGVGGLIVSTLVATAGAKLVSLGEKDQILQA